ncbi:MAG: thiamine-phosphate kinase [Bacteroidaceae bacterium]|nr:thiamine-phosphate kinase [Bacteroidaceae bacterium]MBR4783340.1 thiamine-phosphate kinase [Bacteroidaceae bacterium]
MSQRTEISTLGEFGLIRHLTNDIKPQQPTTVKGVGDDCAVIKAPNGVMVVTTDLLLEGVHFDLTYVPLKHLGYKAASVNISDIYAMNARPTQMTISLGVSKRFCVEDLEQLYAGLRLACEAHGVDLVGGDTTSSLTGLTISITCIGQAEEDKVVYRSGAKDTDLICVSGDLGAAYMGLQLLEREKAVFSQRSADSPNTINDDIQPDFQGKEYLLERQLKPEARGDIILKLSDAGIKPTAMIDISDGLSSELLHICHESHCGCSIYEERLPIDYQTALQAEQFNLSAVTCALNGGEDYELLFTVALKDYERISQIEGIHIIGRIEREEIGAQLITRDGQEYPLKAQGWQHL